METSNNNTSQAGLDARQLAAQLPPGFPRGDEAAIDAVMQLAAFTEQQHHHHHQQQQQQHNQQPPPAPNSSDQVQQVQQDNGDDEQQEPKGSRKRRADSVAGKGPATKNQRESESQEAVHHQNWASFTGQNNEFEHLLQSGAEGHGDGDEKKQQQQQQQQDQQNEQDGGDTSMEGGDILTRHGRPLSTTKRAAQNRAAQRAFRERRDQHVKEVEAKAKQVDEALASAETHRQRYEELLKIIAGLRADNQNLRLTINALGGEAPPPPPAATTSLLGTNGMDGEFPLNLFGETKHEEHQGQDGKQSHENNDGHLDGLSAVAAAAAAAAAAAHVVNQNGDNKDGAQAEQQTTEQEQK